MLVSLACPPRLCQTVLMLEDGRKMRGGAGGGANSWFLILFSYLASNLICGFALCIFPQEEEYLVCLN